MNIKRVFLIVLDSFGIGELPDADKYGDAGSNTLAAVVKSEKFNCPNLKSLGLFNIDGVDCDGGVDMPLGAYGRMAEKSIGKDTTTGHFELCGIVSERPFPTYPGGFPGEIIAEFEKATGRGVLCNKPYSGTQVIKDFGSEHLESGKLIVYTSADSVFQIAAHESIVPRETLYEYCHMARKILVGEHGVGRVIARPFAGEYPEFYRTDGRHDFSLEPSENMLLTALSDAGHDVIAVGKIYDIFCGKGITEAYKAVGNKADMEKTLEYQKKDFHGLCFVNLVDFDQEYGHRNNVDGYADALTQFDKWLGEFMGDMQRDDCLIICADHGCDPSTESTDHSREYVPVLIYGVGIKPENIGTRESFADLSATICEIFGIEKRGSGLSFAKDIVK